jgi:CRP-like cAMP-binding protein
MHGNEGLAPFRLVKGRPVKNCILSSVSEEEFAAVLTHLEFVPLAARQVLLTPGERIEFGYFVNEGVVSSLVVTLDAGSVEVGSVGEEGCVGAELAAGIDESSQRAIVLTPGDALRIKAETLVGLLSQHPGLQKALMRDLMMRGLRVSQLAACNRLHEIEQRLCRWLLTSYDRVGSNPFPVTHDQLSQILGSGRPSLTVAAGILQKNGSVEYKRGLMRILNRKALEECACECYAVMQRISSNT